MIKKKYLIGLSCLALLQPVALSVISSRESQINLVYASEIKLNQSLMSLGNSLTEEQITETKRLLGDVGIAKEAILTVNGEILSKYLPDVENDSRIISSAYIKPMSEGYGVQVEIVTPDKITKVSSTTFQNAAITSGISDVLIRVASVHEVTGEGALAGVYALLEENGVKVNKESIQLGQDEIGLIEDIKGETSLDDGEANKALSQLKKELTERVTDKEDVSNEWIKKRIEKIFGAYQVDLTDNLASALQKWLSDYAGSDAAKQKETIKQLETSLLSEDWGSVLAKLDKILSPNEILNLEKQDYSKKNGYDPIIAKIYDKLLNFIKKDKLDDVKAVYSHTFVIEKMLGNPNSKEIEALNYLRMLCYYFIASQEDERLKEELEEQGRPSWLIGGTTKENFLNALDSYKQLGQVPELQELINRISLFTGYSYEAFLYDDIYQEDNYIILTIVSPWLDNQTQMRVRYNLMTGQCQLFEADNVKELEPFDFKSRYGVHLTNNYQHLVDELSKYTLIDNDKTLLSTKELNKQARLAYLEVLREFVKSIETGDFSALGETAANINDVISLRLKENNDIKDFHYGLVDLDKNGIDELVVTDSGRSIIIGYYAYDGNKAVYLGGTGYRSSFTIFTDGYMTDGGSGGAAVSGLSLYRMNANGYEKDQLLSVTREYDWNDSTKVEYQVKNGKTYSSQEAFKAAYPEVVQYFSAGERSILESSEQAELLDMSQFKQVADFESDTDFIFEDKNLDIDWEELYQNSRKGFSLGNIFAPISNFFKSIWHFLTAPFNSNKGVDSSKIEQQESNQDDSGNVISKSWNNLKGLFAKKRLNLAEIVAGNYQSAMGTWKSATGDVIVIDESGILPNAKQLRQYPNEENRVDERTVSDNKTSIEETLILGESASPDTYRKIVYLPAGESMEVLTMKNGEVEYITFTAEEDSLIDTTPSGVAPPNMPFDKANRIYTKTSPKILSREELAQYYTFWVYAEYATGESLLDEFGTNIYVRRTLKFGERFDLNQLAADFGIKNGKIQQATLSNGTDSIQLPAERAQFKVYEETVDYSSIQIVYELVGGEDGTRDPSSDRSSGGLGQILDNFKDSLSNKSAPSMSINELKKGDYSSVAGYWEADNGGILKIDEDWEFSGVKLGEKIEVAAAVTWTYEKTTASEDNHLLDSVSPPLGYMMKSSMYKYVPKGSRYETSMSDYYSENLEAEEDLILYMMSGMENYTVYRRSPYGEIKQIASDKLSGAGILFSGLLNRELLLTYEGADNNISLYRYDAKEVVDYYNTMFVDTYSLEDVLKEFGQVERRSDKLSSLSESELKNLRSSGEMWSWVYFEGDQSLLLLMGPTGLVGTFPNITDESEWTITDDEIIAPVENVDGSSYGRLIFKKNNKTYKGGRQKSTYYLYKEEKN